MDNILTPSRKRGTDDNLIPLINIVFLLLIFFMVAGQVREQTADQLTLPNNSMGNKPTPVSIKVEINRNGEVFVNHTSVTDTTLISTLATFATQDPTNNTAPQSTIALLADKELSAELLGPVLLNLQQHGFTAIRLYTRDDANDSAGI